MKRLKQSDLAEARSVQAMKQLWICPICMKPIPHGKDVFDHDHETGQMRMVLHRGCNALEGRIHNNCRRHGVPFAELPAWLRGLADYLEKPSLDVLHPTFLTEEEKKARRNRRAKKANSKLLSMPCQPEKCKGGWYYPNYNWGVFKTKIAALRYMNNFSESF